MYGSEARTLIASEGFLGEWQALQSLCPWSTSFTAIPFATTWLNVYRDSYEPVLVWERDTSGRLTGLLLLGHSKKTGGLVPVGGRDAEYTAWLAEPSRGDTFIERALDILRKEFPRATLRFQYLAAGAPIAWIERGHWASRCELQPVSRGLRSVGDGSSFRESLKKKSNKSRVNQLQRVGTLDLVRIACPEEFVTVLDAIAAFSDFRHGAVHDSLPFRSDPLRKQLYIELMRIPHLLHVTVLRLSGKLLAAHIGFYNRDQVLLGIVTHSPFHGQQSPGKLLMLWLGLELAKEAVPILDLTPGTISGYKDRFATHHDQLYVLTVRLAHGQAWRRLIARGAADASRRLLTAINLRPGRVRQNVMAAANIMRDALRALRCPSTIQQNWWYQREVRIYVFDSGHSTPLHDTPRMMRDDVPSLLAFAASPKSGPRSLHEFLSASLRRLENGGHVYTHVVSGRLAHLGWMERPERLLLDEVGQTLNLPPKSLVLEGSFTHPDYAGHDLYFASLCQMLRDASALPDVEHIYIAARGDDDAWRKAVEKAGFVYERSFWKQKRFFHTAEWITEALESA
jgi:CelD/BcsL family acetyltransferase involved in cellulose biosynthesis